MDVRTAALVALGVVLLVSAAPSAINAQQPQQKNSSSSSSSSSTSSSSMWGVDADLKPLMPLPMQPFLPPNSSITAGSASSTQVPTPLFDPTRDQATPGLRLTIPTH